MNQRRFTIGLLFPLALFSAEMDFDLSHPPAPDQVSRWSEKFRNWHYYPDHVIPAKPEIEGVEGVYMTDVPTVFQLEGDPKYYMSFVGFDDRGYQSFVAESTDLLNWSNIQLALGFGELGSFDYGGVVLGAFLYEDYGLKSPRLLKQHEGDYVSLYLGFPRQGGYELRPGGQGVAVSRDAILWERKLQDPILSIFQEDVKEWEKDCIYLPWLVEHEGRYYNFYNAANGKHEQMGLATSEDLWSWTRFPDNPVIANGPEASYHQVFCADGKVFRDEDHWVMIFFGVGRGGAHIMAAYSYDLVQWTVDPEPLYKAKGHPNGLDSQYAHKVSILWNPENETFYMFYNAVGDKGRGIGLLTSKPLARP